MRLYTITHTLQHMHTHTHTARKKPGSSVLLLSSQKEEFRSFWCRNSGRLLEARNELVSSFCPQVFGLYVVKLCVCLALIGGVEVSQTETDKPSSPPLAVTLTPMYNLNERANIGLNWFFPPPKHKLSPYWRKTREEE